jgi:hypothetical protein
MRLAVVLGAAVLFVGVASGALAGRETVLLGVKGLFPHGAGWGTAHPRRIFNGGDPSGTAWKLTWSGWGAHVATAHGLTWIFKPSGGYFAKPGSIELRASRIGRCTSSGGRAYTRLIARTSVRPDGPLGPWFRWNQLTTLCHPR